MNFTSILVDILLVEEQDDIEVIEFLDVGKLVQRVRRQRHLVELGALLL